MPEQLKKSKVFLWLNEKISNVFFRFLKLKDFRKDPIGISIIQQTRLFTPDLSHYKTQVEAYWTRFSNLHLDPLFYAEIKNATIISKGIVVDAQNNVILESTIFQKEYLNNLVSNHFVKFPGFFPSMKEDKVISLLNKLDSNYFHWTLESLTRLLLVYDQLFFGDYKIAIKVGPLPFIKASLAFLFNIPESRLILKPLSINIRANNALVISFPHIRNENTQWTNVYHPEIIQKLNKLAHARLQELEIAQNNFPKNILISRKKATVRRVLNEDELLYILRDHQFQPVCLEDFSFPEQVALFANAEKIIATHGAGITNIVYCKMATVVELFPSKRNIRDAYYFAQISAALELPHHVLFYEALNDKEDVHLPEAILKRIKMIIEPI